LLRKANMSLVVGTSSWREQFIEAVTVSAGRLKTKFHYAIWSQTGSKLTLGAILIVTVKNSSITTKKLYLILTFRSHHEIFIRRSWYSVLPSLDATISCRITKTVVGVTVYFNRIRQVAPVAQERATIALGHVPTAAVVSHVLLWQFHFTAFI